MDKLKEQRIAVTIFVGLAVTAGLFFFANMQVDSAKSQLKTITQRTINETRTKANTTPKDNAVAAKVAARKELHDEESRLREMFGAGGLEQWDTAIERWLPKQDGSGADINDDAIFQAQLGLYTVDLHRSYTQSIANAGGNPDWEENILDANVFQQSFTPGPGLTNQDLQKRFWVLVELISALRDAVDATRKYYRSDEFRESFIDSLVGAAPPKELSLGDAAESPQVPSPRNVAEILYHMFYSDADTVQGLPDGKFKPTTLFLLPVCVIKRIDWYEPEPDVSGVYSRIPFRLDLVVSTHVLEHLGVLMSTPVAPLAVLSKDLAISRRPGVRLDRLSYNMQMESLSLFEQFSFTSDPFQAEWMRRNNLPPEEEPQAPATERWDRGEIARRNTRIYTEYLEFMASHMSPPAVYTMTITGVALDFTIDAVPPLPPLTDQEPAPEEAAPAEGTPEADAGTTTPAG